MIACRSRTATMRRSIRGDPQYVELARLGMVERYRTPSPGFAYDYYRTTDIGRAAAMASHKTIRHSHRASTASFSTCATAALI